MFAVAARSEGIGLVTLAILPLVLSTGLFVIGVSAIVARWGVARPDLDVLHIVVRRPRRKEFKVPGISITASVVQIVLGAFTLPVVKIAPPTSLFHPEIGPSTSFLTTMLVSATASILGTLFVWRGRLSRNAPREQQRKAEEPA